MNTRIMAVALVAVSLLGVRAAHAEDGEMLRVLTFGSPIAGSWAFTDKTVITLGQPNEGTTTFPSGCGQTANFIWGNIEVVVIEPGLHAAVKMTMHPRSDFDLAPGTRLAIPTTDFRECCLDEAGLQIGCTSQDAFSEVRRATFSIIQPASAGAALFSSPAALDVDALGVVTGQPNDDGTHTVIFKKQGSPAQQVNIASFDELFAADVLRDLIDLGQDPDTGEHRYLAFIEW